MTVGSPASFLSRSLAFGVLVIALAGAAHLLLPRHWGDPVLGAKIDAAVGHDPVFIGSSRTLRQFDPTVFDPCMAATAPPHDNGAFNLGRPGMLPPVTYSVLKEVMQRSAPGGTFFVELSPLVNLEARHLKDRRFWYSIDPRTALRLARHTLGLSISPGDRAMHLGHIARAMVRAWFMVGLRATVDGTDPENTLDNIMGSRGDGHRTLDEELTMPWDHSVILARRGDLLADTLKLARRAAAVRSEHGPASPVPISAVHASWLKELIGQATTAGHRLVFVLPPLGTSENENLDALSLTLPASSRIDLRDPDLFPEFYTMALAFDAGHLNEHGAIAYTRALCEQFARLPRTAP